MIYIRQILLISGISTFLVLILGCGNYRRPQSLKNYEKIGVFTGNDIYGKRITPEDFLLSLKNPAQYLYECRVDPDKIQTDWVKKNDVITLSKYLNDSTKCPEVVHVAISSSLHTTYKSTVNEEALKLINIYFTKEYLNFSSENYYSKEKVLEWVKLNN